LGLASLESDLEDACKVDPIKAQDPRLRVFASWLGPKRSRTGGRMQRVIGWEGGTDL